MIRVSTGPHVLDLIKRESHALRLTLRFAERSPSVVRGNVRIGIPRLRGPELPGLRRVGISLTVFINLERWQK